MGFLLFQKRIRLWTKRTGYSVESPDLTLRVGMDRRRGDGELKTEDEMVPSDSVVLDAAEEPRNGGTRRPEGGRWEGEKRHRGGDAGVE